MDIRKVKKLIELLEESGIDELEIREGEESVRISRHSKTAAQPVYAQAPAFAAPAPAPAAAAPAAAAAESAPAAPKLNGNVVRSPMVGTFYRRLADLGQLRRSRPEREERRHPVHRRSHEDDEPHRSRS